MMNKWDLRMLALAAHIALWSKDEKRKVGAVIARTDHTICATGYNGPPRGFEDDLEEDKHDITIHAERNAILQAPEPVRGHTLYCSLMPCHHCSLDIIQSGITRVVFPKPTNHDDCIRWKYAQTVRNFEKAGVSFEMFSG